MPKINFDEIKGGEPIPAGEYFGTVVDAKDGEAASGYPKIDLQWKIEGGEHDGRRVFDTLSFHPKAQFRIKQFWTKTGGDKNFDGELTGDMCIGKTATLVVSIEGAREVDGESYEARNRIKSYKPAKVAASVGEKKKGLFSN